MGNYALEEEVLLKIKTGERRILRAQYEKYREEFKAFLMGKFNCSPENALEVYPESFSRFYFSIKEEKFKPPLSCTLKTYLFTIGKNLYHKTFIRKQNPEFFVEQFPHTGEDADIIVHFDSKGNAELIRRLLQNLKESCRELLRLLFIEEYAPEAVATALNIPSQGALRKRKFDCLNKMRKLLRSEREIKEFGKK